MTGGGPIFLGGIAHSGKTPLRRALGAHPAISMTRKTYTWRRYDGRYGDLSDPENLDELLGAMESDADLDTLGPDFDRIRDELSDGPATYSRLFGLLHAHHAERLGKPRWGDQQGFVERYADQILETWPDARFIHLVRDPRDANSPRIHRSAGKLGWYTAKWAESADWALRNSLHHSDNYLVLKYEDLRKAPEPTIRRVCSFISEGFFPGMLDAMGKSALQHDRATLSAASAGLSASAMAFVQSHTQDRLECLGYPLESHDHSQFAHPRPVDLLGLAAWRIVRPSSDRAS